MTTVFPIIVTHGGTHTAIHTDTDTVCAYTLERFKVKVEDSQTKKTDKLKEYSRNFTLHFHKIRTLEKDIERIMIRIDSWSILT